MKAEMINDAIDDGNQDQLRFDSILFEFFANVIISAMEDEGDKEESDGVVAQVLDKLGLQLTDQLSGLPQARNFFQTCANY